MKVERVVERNICDFCEKNTTIDYCMSCGKDICYECIKKEDKVAEEFNTMFHFDGMDVVFCNDCLNKHKSGNKDILIEKCYELRNLRQERTIFISELNNKGIEIENELTKEHDRRRKIYRENKSK